MTRAERLDSAIAYAADVLTRKRIDIFAETNIRLTFYEAKKRLPPRRVKVASKS